MLSKELVVLTHNFDLKNLIFLTVMCENYMKIYLDTVDSVIFVGTNFSRIKENLYVCGYLISWFCRGMHTI